MPRIPDGGCQIKATDLVDAPYTSQLTYRLLREQGAPIMGQAVLLLDPAYRWYVHHNSRFDTMQYSWEFVD